MELIRADALGITGETEVLEAACRAREEEKLKNVLARPTTGGRPGEYPPKGKKGKDGKGQGKSGSEDGKRGKGGDGKKDQKHQWEKTDK